MACRKGGEARAKTEKPARAFQTDNANNQKGV